MKIWEMLRAAGCGPEPIRGMRKGESKSIFDLVDLWGETHSMVCGGRFYLKLGCELVPSQEGEYYALDLDKFLDECHAD